MAVSEAQKKSAQKWDAANLDRVSIAMPKGMKDTVKAGAILTPTALKTAQEAAQRAGETIPAFVSRAVETQAQRDKVMQAMRPKEKAGE